MKLGILETGRPSQSTIERYGDYPAMFRALLGERAHDYQTYDVAAGDLPRAAGACEAWLVTGSSAGVYDPQPWIAALMDFLRAAKGRTPMVGICFGHQVMAQAFGGQVIKSPKGWGVGLHQYAVREVRPWMDPVAQIAIPAWHQDQVVTPPPDAAVIAGSDFCPVAMLAYDGGSAISLQPHPEFQPAYAQAGLERRKMGLSEAETSRAVSSLDEVNDNARLGRWISHFLSGTVA